MPELAAEEHSAVLNLLQQYGDAGVGAMREAAQRCSHRTVI
jgi:hypothetical protein